MMLEGEALYLTWANLYGSCEVNSQQPGTHDLRRLVRRASPISTEMRMAVQIINWWCEHQKVPRVWSSKGQSSDWPGQ